MASASHETRGEWIFLFVCGFVCGVFFAIEEPLYMFVDKRKKMVELGAGGEEKKGDV